jgi:multisubunit Na+/H+ antiporter MnhB subunit
MNKRSLLTILALVILLTLGWVLFRTLNTPAALPAGEEDFRAWFWDKRGLDLVVQVLLVFAGALGIAAILPEEDEDA